MLIGELSRRSGVSVRMLRHYDGIGAVSPSSRSGSGYREYGADDMRRLLRLEALRALGLTIAEAAAAIDDSHFDPAEVIAALRREAEDRIARERAVLARLEEIDSAEPESWDGVLELVDLLSALRSGSARVRYSAALRSGNDPSRVSAQLVESYLAESETNAAGALRWAVVRAGAGAAELLARRVRDPDPRVRLCAALALGDFVDASDAGTDASDAAGRGIAEAALGELLGDEDAEVGDRAAIVLAARDSGGGSDGKRSELIARLVAMVGAGRRDVEAAEALGAIAGRSAEAQGRVLGAIAEGLRSGSPQDPRDAAARGRLTQALGELRGRSVDALLSELARDPEPAVARVAGYLLQR